VTNLLQKYNLLNLPKLPELSYHPPKVSARQLNPTKRRNTVKRVEVKTKSINKVHYKQQNYLYLLTRKIHHLLKQKEGLSSQKRKEISCSLAKGVIGGGGVEEVNAVLKWVMISSS